MVVLLLAPYNVIKLEHIRPLNVRVYASFHPINVVASAVIHPENVIAQLDLVTGDMVKCRREG